MLSFRLAINDLAVVSWNVAFFVQDIFVPVGVSRFALSSQSLRTQFAADVIASSNV